MKPNTRLGGRRYTATTDSTCTDEDLISVLDEKKSKKREKRASENKAAKVSKTIPVPERASASNVVTKVKDACSFFYRFTCEWSVTGAAYGTSSNSNNNMMICKRNITEIDEARDHLVNHLISSGLALQCSWHSCNVEFSDVDKLKEHVVLHAEVKSAALFCKPYATTPTPVEHTVPVSKVKKNSGADFNARFASRKLANHNGVSSCINSTLQALLTTGLSNIQRRMCGPQAGCYLCYVLSAMRRVLQTREGKTVDPFELVLKKGGLGVPDAGEGDPISYLVGLIEAVAVDEESWHSSSDTNYKFTIRFQKSCPCTESCEAHHWVLRPSNVNQSLYDLMMEHSVYCGQCGVEAKTQPVMMPENLIFTLASTLQDSRLVYPEDLPTSNGCYLLSAVIVATGSPRHYSAYCRVFGVWMHYDDEDSRKVSCGDVLCQGAQVCVLIYVTKELTAGDIRLALTKAKELNKTKVPIIVKEERH